MTVARIWTRDDSVVAAVASPVSISSEWIECGADKWHDIRILGSAISSSEILSNATYSDADGLLIEGREIEIVSTSDL